MQQLTVKQKYRGVIVPMVTPLDKQGRIDRDGVAKLIERMLAEGCAPFVAGTTGESASLTEEIKADLVRTAVAVSAGAEPVYAGIADNCLEGSLRKARLYSELGADVAVCHLPTYYPIDGDQMRDWFSRLANQCPLPLVLYNIPATTGLSIPLPLADELSHHENIVGIKDSERDEERMRRSVALWRERDDFTLHAGWAARSSWGVLNGFDGIVPSTANLVPGLYRKLYDAASRGDAEESDRIQLLTDEISALYQEGRSLSRSIPALKAMLAAFGLCEPYVAPPMLTLARTDLETIADAVRKWGDVAG